MPPRASSSTPRTASSAPYPRRAAGQPKSTRQQFSACGACRMRRVRCDLKDLAPSAASAGAQPSCSNCKERGIKCVDEFAEVKAVKLLRRGRRLQQVEAVYGKVVDDPSTPPNSATTSSFPTVISSPKQSVTPPLKLEFFNSSFFCRFCVQRPVLEPTEFMARYIAHVKGITPLNIEGQMLAMLLVAWAASFGVNEYGVEEDNQPTSPDSSTGPKLSPDADNELSDPGLRVRSLRTEAMTREILGLVDMHGILRRPSWDGVRVLLLLYPLTVGIQSPIERLTTYEATLSHIYALCSLVNPSSVSSGQGPYYDALVRARIFWYAYVHEGVTTGLRGGRLLLDEDDLRAFQSTLPPLYCAAASIDTSTSAPASTHSSPTPGSPVSSEFPLQDLRGHSRASFSYLLVSHYFSLTLAVSRECRSIHAVLTGPAARRSADAGIPVREGALMEIWDNLEHCWSDFEALRRGAGGVAGVGADVIRGENVERFVSGWQVFIFECLNVIREALKQQMLTHTHSGSTPAGSDRSTPSDQVLVANLHAHAVRRCRVLVPRVIDILKRHLAVPSSGFFAHDTGLVRDGCFFAGLLLAQSDMDVEGDDNTRWDADVEEGVDVCLRALGEIRWVHANNHKRERTLRSIWDARLKRDNERRRSRPHHFVGEQRPAFRPEQIAQGSSSSYMDDHSSLSRSGQHNVPSNGHPRSLSLVSAGGQARPHLPPISVSFAHMENGPETALTDDGSDGWPTYTPPTTSGSMTSTVATRRSLSPLSPPLQPQLKHVQRALKTEDAYYGADPFSFSVNGAAGTQNLVGPGLGTPPWPTYAHQPPAPDNGYLDPSVIFTGTDAVLARVSEDGCPHFGSDCQAFYH
ncbi:hypothetical protein F5I97DRAFT_606993 [Phlebopus sp. FC_14]|nr:hypothetical protein F5I97DRAFT_606993 [Phlebopus sp. FC_14]